MTISPAKPSSLVLSLKTADLMPGFTHASGSTIDIFFDQTKLKAPSVDWFDPTHSSLAAHPVSQGGRNAAWFVSVEGVNAVLRQYRRGGWAAKLSKHDYLWIGLQNTRAYQELGLLHQLYVQGLRVPRPLAMAVWHRGLFYQAAMLTERIPGARPISDAASPKVWGRAGQVIAQMHRLGVYHADLNVFNILVDQHDEVWLIDFDRCWQGRPSEAARLSNLARLKRSVLKVNRVLIDDCYHALVIGYDSSLKAGEI